VRLMGPRPSAGAFLCVAPVAPGGVDGVTAEVFAGGRVDDFDCGVVNEYDCGGAGVGGADGERV
jgi:hypothetical protein